MYALKRTFLTAFPKSDQADQPPRKKSSEDALVSQLSRVYGRNPFPDEIQTAKEKKLNFKAVQMKAVVISNFFRDPSLGDSLVRAIKILCYKEERNLFLAKRYPDKTLYIKKSEYQLPFSIILHTEDDQRLKSYIHFKKNLLGQGTSKWIYLGYCLESDALVSIADFKKDYNKDDVDHEFEMQKFFGEAFALCPHYNHKNSKRRYKIVMPYMNQGNLLKFLQSHPLLDHEMKQRILNGLLHCFNRIHRAQIVTGDITLKNILVHMASEKKIQIHFNDFGLSFSEKYEISNFRETTYQFESPEQRGLNDDVPITRKADVYQLALVIWRIFINWHESIRMATEKDFSEYRKQISQNYSENSLQEILLRMLSPNPDSRPSLEEVIKLKPTIPEVNNIKTRSSRAPSNSI